MNTIIVTNQKELDAIPVNTNKFIKITFGTHLEPAVIHTRYEYPVIARGNSSVIARGNSSVIAYENSSVEAYGNSSVIAYENSSVIAYGNNSVEAYGNGSIIARGNSLVEAYRNSLVEAYENSSVEAYENSSVEAYENSSVEARGNSSVIAYENSSVIARGNSSVIAYENSSVEAYENSSVIARENSSVEAYENSSVEAYGNGSVEAYGNVRVVDYLQGATIRLSGNARAVFMPRNIKEFMTFYGIEHDKTMAIFYKAVHKKISGNIFADNKKVTALCDYVSDYDRNFKYEIGKKISSNGFDDDVNKDCGKGIHISHKSWALNYGRNWDDLAILEVKVKIKDILLPAHSDGKVRAPKVEILREVPLEECGLLGKIIINRHKNKKIENHSKLTILNS